MRSSAAAYVAICTLGAGIMLGACDTQQQPRITLPQIISSAAAQQADLVVPPSAITGKMEPIDEAFASFAASFGLAQIEASRIVLKTTRESGVRDYALRIGRDHARSHDELKRIASERGYRLPGAPTGRHLDMVTKLIGVAPQDMDDAFLRRFGLDAHKEALSLFEAQVSKSRDPAVKQHAEQTLTMLRDHMTSAQQLVHATGTR
jgi:putative membrane protein